MNKVILIGRLTKDPELTVSGKTQTQICRFNLAINKGKDANGNDMGADYPSCIAFNKTAEVISKYCTKGSQIGIEGNLMTGSYEKEGQKHYTTDVLVQKVEFLSKKEEKTEKTDDDTPSGFAKLSQEEIDALPF